MEYRTLGNSSLRISTVAFGCMSLPKEEKEAGQLLHGAWEKGINFFDTADLYDQGRNETLVGKALLPKRKEVVLATKVGNQWREDGSGWDWNPRKAYILKAVEASLQRLQTDYIDLYQLHGGTLEDPIDETIEAFEQLKQEGKIRYYGISSIRPNVIREWIERSSLTSVMMQYSLLDRRPEETIFPLLTEKNIAVLARGSVAQGLLVNKPPKTYLDHQPDNVRKAAEAVHALSGTERSPAQTALLFALAQQAVHAAVLGIRTPEQLSEAAGAFSVPPLTGSDLETLRASVPALVYQQHR